MRRIIVSFVVVLCLLLLFGCALLSSGEYRVSYEGFEKMNPDLSSAGLTDIYLLNKKFLSDYPYLNGNFFYVFYKPSKYSMYCGEQSFVWIVYNDDDVYQNAKQSRFDSRSVSLESFDGTKAFGFSFYLYFDWKKEEGKTPFPDWFTAFGYNDELKTLVFLGFDGQTGKDEPFIESASMDFSAFLTHYYGDWFDWEAGVGKSSSTENSN